MKIYDKQAEFIQSEADTTLFVSGVGAGKCLDSSTLINTSVGLMKFSELLCLWDNGVRPSILSECGCKRIVDVIDTGFVNCHRVVVSNGTVIIAGDNHKFRVLSEDFEIVWKRSCDLKCGDKVLVSKNISSDAGVIDLLTRGLAYFTGVMSGDGCLTGNNRSVIGISVGGKDYRGSPDYTNYLRELFHRFVGASDFIRDTREDCYNIRKTNKHFSNFLLESGYYIDRYANGVDLFKQIPRFILRACIMDRVDYLAGLIDTDGYIGKDIEIINKSEKFIRDLNSLLCSIGGLNVTISKKHVDVIKGKNYSYDVNRDFWRLNIRGVTSFNRLKLLGLKLRTTYRAEAFEKLCNKSLRGSNNRSIVPYAHDALRRLHTRAVSMGIRTGHGSSIGSLFCGMNGKQNISMETLRRCYAKYPDLFSAEPTILYLLNNDCYVSGVVESIDVGERHCCDLTVEGSPTYIVDGLISHNTTAGALWALNQISKFPQAVGFVGANTYLQLHKSTLPKLTKMMREIGIDFVFNRAPRPSGGISLSLRTIRM